MAMSTRPIYNRAHAAHRVSEVTKVCLRLAGGEFQMCLFDTLQRQRASSDCDMFMTVYAHIQSVCNLCSIITGFNSPNRSDKPVCRPGSKLGGRV